MNFVYNEKPIRKEINCDYKNCGCRYNTFIWYSDILNAVYYETPKAACSSVKNALGIFMNDEHCIRGYMELKHNQNLKPYTKYKIGLHTLSGNFCMKRRLRIRENDFLKGNKFNISVGEYDFKMYYGTYEESLIKFQNYFKFGFVRNPLKRAVSNYQMFFDKKNIYRFEQVQNLYGKDAGNLSFEDFIKSLSKKFNHHWDLYSNYFNVQDLDFVGKIENMNHDWKKIMNKLNIKNDIPHKNKSKTVSISMTDEVANMIYEKYKLDYVNFKYEK